ncbi:GFA family protein [bacterium]|nr:GFA family protein [bacterium]NCQ54774.1 GFA family protein [Candidatus Parcubacteria bacterium]NCS68027.1 GFA family protein [Candidatus Peregrinibacteria bacterium]NCS95764.1 GFA family protein [bacterium]
MKNKISCLCGACEFGVELENNEIGACHCHMCQKWAAGLFMAAHLKNAVDFTSIKSAKVYVSSEWGRRIFCENCGTILAWQMADASFTAVSAGALENKDGLVYAEEIFVDEKVPAYPLAESTRKKTGVEVFAQFES